MSQISDYKSSPFALFGQGTSTTAGTGVTDAGIAREVGTRFTLDDGREVALVSNGVAALVSGNLIQTEAEVTAFHKLAMTVPATYPASIGNNQILVTNGATVLNVNQYQGGFASVTAGAGIGQSFRIASHAAAANGATFVVTIEEKILVTLDATSKITLMQNPYKNVIQTPITTATGATVGISLYPVAAAVASTYNATTGKLTTAGVDQYAFIGVRGMFNVLVDNTVTNVGYPIGVSKTTAGTVGLVTLTTVPQIGISAQTLTSAETGMVYISL
jgi:hypothetical protein